MIREWEFDIRNRDSINQGMIWERTIKIKTLAAGIHTKCARNVTFRTAKRVGEAGAWPFAENVNHSCTKCDLPDCEAGRRGARLAVCEKCQPFLNQM